MIKCIYKGSTKNIPYGKIYGTALIKSLGNEVFIRKGISVTLAALFGKKLQIIKPNIGIVVEAKDNEVLIKFNTDIAYDQEIYAISNSSNCKELKELVLAYIAEQ